MSNDMVKSLISEMIEAKLDETSSNDLLASIFEEVSEETWQSIEEAILAELSPSTMGRFIAHKAASAVKRKVVGGLMSKPSAFSAVRDTIKSTQSDYNRFKKDRNLQ
jgi:hypothetical protein